MPTPLSLPDVEYATDAQIVAAYIEDGETEDPARALLAQLRGEIPPGAILD